jgi:hypothetical protein
MTELWNARRVKLEKAVQSAVMDLFEHMGTASAFKLSLDPNTPALIMIAGPRKDVERMVSRRMADALEAISHIHDGNPSLVMADLPAVDYARHMLGEARATAREALLPDPNDD